MQPQGGAVVLFDLLFKMTNPSEVFLVDRFAVNISNVPDGSATVQSHSGVFGLASVSTSSTLMCSSQFTGPICTVCQSGCDCAAGFTGPMCATSIDDCAGVDCGENLRCVDGFLDHTCVCEPGFTGLECLTDIDECLEVDCHNGECSNEVGSFRCDCSAGFTGSLCDTSIDSELSTADTTDIHSSHTDSDSAPSITTADTTETHSSNADTTIAISNSDQNTMTIVVLIVMVALLLVTVVLIAIGFSLILFFKGKKSRSREIRPVNASDTAPNSINLEPNRAAQIDNTLDPDYDYPNIICLDSTLYKNNTRARAQVNNVVDNVPLTECPAYVPVTGKDCVPCPAYATYNGRADNNLEESDDHTYY